MADGPKYNGTDGAPIDLATARQWVANYKTQNPGQVVAHYFGKDIIQHILLENDCSGIRIYYALDDKGARQLLVVGVNTKGDNLLPEEGSEGGGNQIADYSFPCPPYCGQGGDNL